MSKSVLIAKRAVGMVVALLVVVALSLGYVWATRAKEETTKVRRAHPALFSAPYPCRSGPSADARARRFERYAQLHTERYPYDPADGVRAVLHLLSAASCYTSAGNGDDALRVTTRARDLSSRIETDYASARIALEKTLAARNWSSALPEVRRLIRLTQHLRPSPYITWLEATFGEVAARADETP